MSLPPPSISILPLVDFTANREEARALRSFFLNCIRVQVSAPGPISKVRLIQGSETLTLFCLDDQRANQENYSGKEKCRVTIYFDFLILVQEAQFP